MTALLEINSGIKPFIDTLGQDKWLIRKNNIIKELKEIKVGTNLGQAEPTAIRNDKIGWFLFLCEQAVSESRCYDVVQLAHIAPFFVGIGLRWDYAKQVTGLESKIEEVLHKQKRDPHGLIFEILIALSYAAKGWDVKFIKESPPAKSPDMLVSRKIGTKNIQVQVECKNLSQHTDYAKQEREIFLKLWNNAEDILRRNQQWLWFNGKCQASCHCF